MHGTIQDAAKWPCPLAKTFAEPKRECRGEACPLWRWTTGAPHAEAVKKIADATGEKQPFKNAAAEVAKDPAKHGCHGYCGLGGGI